MTQVGPTEPAPDFKPELREQGKPSNEKSCPARLGASATRAPPERHHALPGGSKAEREQHRAGGESLGWNGTGTGLSLVGQELRLRH